MSKSDAGLTGHLILFAVRSATTIGTAAGGNMLEDTARYYDRIYAFKDYATEAKTLTDIVETELGGTQGRLLDVACGTARYLELLRSSFDVEGLDLLARASCGARNACPTFGCTAPTCGSSRFLRVSMSSPACSARSAT